MRNKLSVKRDEPTTLCERRKMMLKKIADVRNAISTIAPPLRVESQFTSSEQFKMTPEVQSDRSFSADTGDKLRCVPSASPEMRSSTLDLNNRLLEAKKLIENLTAEKEYLTQISQKKETQLRELIFSDRSNQFSRSEEYVPEKLLCDIALNAWRLVSTCGVVGSSDILGDAPSFPVSGSTVERREQNTKLTYLLSCLEKLQLEIPNLANLLQEAEERCASIYSFSGQAISTFCSDRARDSLKIMLLVDQLEQLQRRNALSSDAEGSDSDQSARQVTVGYEKMETESDTQVIRASMSQGSVDREGECLNKYRSTCSASSFEVHHAIEEVEHLAERVAFSCSCEATKLELQQEITNGHRKRSLKESLALLEVVVNNVTLDKSEPLWKLTSSGLHGLKKDSIPVDSYSVKEEYVALLQSSIALLTMNDFKCEGLERHDSFFEIGSAIAIALNIDRQSDAKEIRLAFLLRLLFVNTNVFPSVVENATNASLMTYFMTRSYTFLQLPPHVVSAVVLLAGFGVCYCRAEADKLLDELCAAYQLDEMGGADERHDLKFVLNMKHNAIDCTLPIVIQTFASWRDAHERSEAHDCELLLLKVVVHVAKLLHTTRVDPNRFPREFLMFWDGTILPCILLLSYMGLPLSAVMFLVEYRNSIYESYLNERVPDTERREEALNPGLITSFLSSVRGEGENGSCHSESPTHEGLLAELLKLYKENQMYRNYIEQMISASDAL